MDGQTESEVIQPIVDEDRILEGKNLETQEGLSGDLQEVSIRDDQTQV
ncbi:MAG: hypothetical protein KAH57_07420 [Thermoplasmata archaeon]|nr:hypothetical protein [Thermoplasmata archaeon]